MANFAGPIEPVQNLGGAVSFPTESIIEEAGQTFNAWTPVALAADGGVQVWGASVVLPGIGAVIGVAQENASNLGTTGSGAPQGFTPVLGFGSVIGNYKANPANQPLAVVTPSLVPINDGLINVVLAAPGTVFVGKCGTSGNAAATTNQMVSTLMGLALDSNGYWYVATNLTNLVQIVALDPRDAVGTVGGRLWFTFLASAVGLFA